MYKLSDRSYFTQQLILDEEKTISNSLSFIYKDHLL